MAYPNRNPSQIALDLEGEDEQNRPTVAEQVARLKAQPGPQPGDEVELKDGRRLVVQEPLDARDPTGPDFDGETYDPITDYERLSQQLKDVWDVLTRNTERWWTITGLCETIQEEKRRYHSEAGISARLRDLRKPKYGRYVVERKSLGGGLFAYRLDPEHMANRWGFTTRG
jgi:hypothetical protein